MPETTRARLGAEALDRLADLAVSAAPNYYLGPITRVVRDYVDAANPATILTLVAEVRALRVQLAQHEAAHRAYLASEGFDVAPYRGADRVGFSAGFTLYPSKGASE